MPVIRVYEGKCFFLVRLDWQWGYMVACTQGLDRILLGWEIGQLVKTSIWKSISHSEYLDSILALLPIPAYCYFAPWEAVGDSWSYWILPTHMQDLYWFVGILDSDWPITSYWRLPLSAVCGFEQVNKKMGAWSLLLCCHIRKEIRQLFTILCILPVVIYTDDKNKVEHKWK